jgi:Tol biopolymer transport system component
MTTDLQELFDQAGRTPPGRAFDADAVLRRARRSRNRRITGAVAATVVLTLAVVVGTASQRLLSADPLPATPVPTATPLPPAQALGTLGRLAYGIDGDVYVADADGSNPVRIADGAPGVDGNCPSYWGEGPIWSPDGRYLAYRGDLTGGDTSTTECSWPRTVNITDPAGHRVTSFPGEGWLISWSPDSTRVAVWVDFWTNIGVYGLDGSRQALLPVPPGLRTGGDHDPVWSPDGTSLLLPEGVIVPVDGSTPRQLPAHDPRSQWKATYSPDGAEVAYVIHDGLAVADADGSQARLLVPGGGLRDYQAAPLAWSPTGDRIAFASRTCGGSTNKARTIELCVVDEASGTVVSMADMSGREVIGFIKFSPEADRILFTRTDTDGVASLWSVHADGSALRRVVAGTSWGDWQRLIPTR